MGPLDVIHESIFGPASKEGWKPLGFSTFFSEGWADPLGAEGAPPREG